MKRLLLVDDDKDFTLMLSSALARRQYDVIVAQGRIPALQQMAEHIFDYAVVDLKMPDGSGLEVVTALHKAQPQTKIVVLTGYASITTAVEAIKLGACHYLAKPANADDIVAAFTREEGDAAVPVTHQVTSIDGLEWEAIQHVLVETDYNISETARKLGMHRRTLQRKIQKRHIPLK